MAAFAWGVNALKLDADKNRPVTKVITLLKDMQKQLEKESEEDQAIYDKMACWCETNDKEKTQAIKEAEVRIEQLTATIEEKTALSAKLTAEIKNLEKEVAANQAALDKATAIRQKELASFNAEEKDLLQSIGALKSAITVLSKHHSSFVQAEESSTGITVNVAAMLKHAFNKHSDVLLQVITPSQHTKVEQFIQDALAHGQAPSAGSYAPQSGEIFGILRQMLETFESNLSQSQKDEMAAQAAFEELKAAKEAEIAAGQEQIDTKTSEEADASEKAAQAKEDLEDTKASLSADEQFLMMLKEKCAMTDKEWEARQKTRSEEIAAVSKAVQILSGDDAHDTFTRTFNFAQLSMMSAAEKDVRSKAAAVLKKVNNPKLSALAEKVKLDAFTKVKKAIDDMISALLQEKADEIKHKDFCVAEFNENEKQTTHETRNKEDLEAKIADLAAQIDVLTKEIAGLNAEIQEMKVQMKRAGEDREKQNAEFQATIADQRATMKLLNSAMAVLKSFYAKQALIQMSKQEPAGPPPPAGFKAYENNAGGSGVIAMLTQIVNDAKMMEQEAIHDETDAQKAYETFVQDTNLSIDEKTKSVVNKTANKAQAEADKVAAEEELDSTNLELEQLANYKADLHKSCDFTLKNFDLRQDARDQEVEALRQAKAILSGAKFD